MSKYYAEDGKLYRLANKGVDGIPMRASRVLREIRKQENIVAAKDAEIAKLRGALDEASIFATHIMKTTSNNGHWECARCALITIEDATK